MPPERWTRADGSSYLDLDGTDGYDRVTWLEDWRDRPRLEVTPTAQLSPQDGQHSASTAREARVTAERLSSLRDRLSAAVERVRAGETSALDELRLAIAAAKEVLR